MIYDPTTLNYAALSAAHVALCQVEQELRAANRTEAADAVAYADVVLLSARHALRRASGDATAPEGMLAIARTRSPASAPKA
jgi:hypothetical protein